MTDPKTINAAGLRALDAGDAVAARDLFARAAALDPAATALWLNVAKAHRELGDDVGERTSLERALAVDAHDLTALIRLAELHQRRGELPLALKTWSGVLAVAPPPAARSPQLAAVLADAQRFVEDRTLAFATTIDEGLADARARVAPAERRRTDAAFAVATGRRRIYVNECAGLHVPFLPADEFFDDTHFPWFPAFEAQAPAIADELRVLLATGEETIEPYVAIEPGAPANKWSALDRSLDWSAYYLWKYGEPVERALARCPATAAALAVIPRADLPRRAPTAFFSILRPRVRIPPHTGVSNTRAIVHLPLIVPPGCGFRVGGDTRQWVEGRAFAFDDTIEHEAWNDSDELRAVLIVDVWNPHLTKVEREQIRAFYTAADASEHNPDRPAG